MDESSEQTTETVAGSFSEHSQVLNAALDELLAKPSQLNEENERLLTDASELRESNRQLMELLEQKESEMSEKNSTYLDRIEALETELAQSQASFTQLDLELKAKADDLINLQKRYGEFEVEVSAKVSDVETKWNEKCIALTMNNVRAVEMESKMASLEQELTVAKDAAALYKVSSEEWSKKAGELKGVAKSLEGESNESLAKEVSGRMEIEKEANGLKEKLDQCLADLESLRKTCLGRDGLGMTTLYVNYQEASDALRHEQMERKQSQAVLDRVLREMEQKAGFILEERAKHERILDSYSEIDKKFQNSLSDQTELQRLIQELKTKMRRKDRENDMAQKEVFDLQNQVAILLKECQDISLHKTDASGKNSMLSFKDISGIVKQNVELKLSVDSLSEDIVSQEKSWKEKYERDLEKSTENAIANFNLVIAREKEQKQMIESLHTSVATYKKLYEEELAKLQSPATSLSEEPMTKKRKLNNVPNVVDNSREIFQNAHEKALERVKHLEEELSKSVNEITSLKTEAEKLALEARSSQEKLERFTKYFEHQRDLYNSSKARNDQYSQMIIDYQEKMRKNSDLMNSALDSSHKLTMEVSLLKQEKEIAVSSEKRAYEEVCSLSERISRLQASLDTIQSTEKVREEARSAERRKHELSIQETERKSADAIKELHEKVQQITLEHENALNIALQKADEVEKEVRRVLCDLAAAEVRASDAEEKVKCLQAMVSDNNESLAKEEALKQLEAEAAKKSLEADVLFLRETIEDLKGKLDTKSNDVGKEDNKSEITVLEAQIASLKDDLEKERNKSSAAEANYERQVSLQSDANQELNKVSLTLAALQEEASALRNENSELKAKWEAEKTTLEGLKTDADKKYDEVNELNKVLLREKDDLISKQNQLLSDANVAGDKALKEQVEEKEARIQILQKTVERLKENLKKQKDECKMEKERREKLEKTVQDSHEITASEQPDKSTVDDGPKPISPSDNLCLKRPSFSSSEEAAEPPVKKSKLLAPENETAPEVITLNQAAKEETGKLIDINVECETAANILEKLSSKSGAVGAPSEINVSSTLPRRGRGRPPGGRGRGRGRLSRG